MHYNIVYQKNLPPFVTNTQQIEATSEKDAKDKWRALHPYKEYADEYVVMINKRKDK